MNDATTPELISGRLVPRQERLLHSLVDGIAMFVPFIPIFWILAAFIGVPPKNGPQPLAWDIAFDVYFLIGFFGYFGLSEWYWGMTLGHRITRSQVVRVVRVEGDIVHGEPLSLRRALVRTLARLIPFDQVAVLVSGTAFHDSASETRVIKTRS